MKIKRIYDPPEKDDGTRILVDRLWPRGLTKEKAAVDIWMKDIAPSTALRKWYNHEPAKWEEFILRYRQELEHNKEQVALLKKELPKGVTLLYAAKDEMHNDAVVLKELLEKDS